MSWIFLGKKTAVCPAPPRRENYKSAKTGKKICTLQMS